MVPLAFAALFVFHCSAQVCRRPRWGVWLAKLGEIAVGRIAPLVEGAIGAFDMVVGAGAGGAFAVVVGAGAGAIGAVVVGVGLGAVVGTDEGTVAAGVVPGATFSVFASAAHCL